ncbi:hypothetical protein OIV83_004839 [Microbotryomycetes sp. JL201]|nr:hypothetical protein OIV83_004839 [Microbotryomycetes sp. JL201]
MVPLLLASCARLKALMIDLSGTLHVGDEPTRDAARAIDALRHRQIALRFVSNTSKESKQSLLDKMKRMKLDVREDELFTSLSAVRQLVDDERLCPMYLLSDSARTDFPPSQPPYDSVVVGLAPSKLGYETGLNEAFRVLAKESNVTEAANVRLIATHKAKYVRDKDGKLSLGPGPFISALEEAADVQSEIVGKPTRAFFKLALKSLEKEGIHETDWQSVGMIGDDALQDVGLEAKSLGLFRMLVRTGKYRNGDEQKVIDAEPDWCGQDFAVAVDNILQM